VPARRVNPDSPAAGRLDASSDARPAPTDASEARSSRFWIWRSVMRGFASWHHHDGPRLGAAVAYYSIFALAPTLVIAISIAGAVFGADAARGHLVTQLGGLVGEEAARNIEAMIASAWKGGNKGFAAALGVGTLLLASTGVFAELRHALNAMFDVQHEPTALSGLLRARVTGLALVLAFGFLLIISLMLSAALAALSQWLSQRYPAAAPALAALDLVTSVAILAVAFGVILRGLPVRRPSWRATVIGALTSAVLFSIGKQLVAQYLVRAGVSTSYGAAGSFVVVIFWIFYSTQVLLIGAAIGQQVALGRRGAARHAVKGRDTAAPTDQRRDASEGTEKRPDSAGREHRPAGTGAV
jgi:membrane protein